MSVRRTGSSWGLNPVSIWSLRSLRSLRKKKKLQRPQRSYETTLQRSQRQQSLRCKKFSLSDRCRCDRWRLVSIWSLNFFFSAIVAIIWKPGLIYRNNHPPFLLNCYLYALQTYRTHSSKLRLLLVIRCISLVVDFVLLGGTNSVLLIWGLMVYSVFCQILPRKTVNAFCTASFTSWYKFSYRVLARQSRLSVIPY